MINTVVRKEMKKDLVKAAEKCLLSGRMWFSPFILGDGIFSILNSEYADEADTHVYDPMGEDASWFLLMCAEDLQYDNA